MRNPCTECVIHALNVYYTMYNKIKGETCKMEEMPTIEVEKLIEIFLNEGREGLVKELCTFPDMPNLNSIMEEMVDYLMAVFTGEMPPGLFTQKMETLSDRFYNEICDVALDEFNEGNITGEFMAENLNELQEIKAKFDNN